MIQAETKQPDFLMTDEHVPWSWGRGNEVWSMFEAAISGNVASLEQLLDNDSSLIRCSCNYRTPLHFAVRENQFEAARFLLTRGADVTYTGERGGHNSPQQMCRDRGNLELLKLIDEHQNSLWQICPEGDLVAVAARHRKFEAIKKLVDQHGVDIADQRGCEPIHWAVMIRNVELIDWLLSKGADVNSQRPDGARPIDLSNGDYWFRGWNELADSDVNHMSIMDHLLSKGANYDLTTACRRNDIDRVRTILDDDAQAATRDADYSTWYSGYALRSAAKAGYIELVRLLLEHGADPNRAEHGLAPFGGSLYDSAQNGHYEVVKLLLEHGGDPNQDVESSGCPLSAATDDRTRKLLRDHGAIYDPFVCCYYGHPEDFAIQCKQNPIVAKNSMLFAMAAENGLREIVNTFLEYQPDLWERMPAFMGKSTDLTRWMIDSGMNLVASDWLGVHAMHRARVSNEIEEWLLHINDLDLIDGEHQTTPLGAAARRGDIEVVRTLMQSKADPQLAGEDWAVPIEWARRRGHEEVAALLENI